MANEAVQIHEAAVTLADQAQPAATLGDGSRKVDRITLTLSPEAREALDELVRERQVTLAEVVRRALGTELALYRHVKQRNGSIYLDVPGDPMKELILV